jgi:hypothetical protein
VLACVHVFAEEKQRLRNIAGAINSFELKRRIEGKLEAIFQLISVTSNVRQRI